MFECVCVCVCERFWECVHERACKRPCFRARRFKSAHKSVHKPGPLAVLNHKPLRSTPSDCVGTLLGNIKYLYNIIYDPTAAAGAENTLDPL